MIWYFTFRYIRIIIISQRNKELKGDDLMKALKKLEELLSEYYETFKH